VDDGCHAIDDELFKNPICLQRALVTYLLYSCAAVGVFDLDLDYVSIALLFSVLALDLFVTKTSRVYVHIYIYIYIYIDMYVLFWC
jgi:hypothetical protein